MLLTYHKHGKQRVCKRPQNRVADITRNTVKKKRRGEQARTNIWACTQLCICDQYYSLGKPKIAKETKFSWVPEAVIHLKSTAARTQILFLPRGAHFSISQGICAVQSSSQPVGWQQREMASSSPGQPRSPSQAKPRNRARGSSKAANTTAYKSCQRARNCLWENITYP